MKLSDLKSGESGIIVKVHGHGGFRKRIVEMGFIRGVLVETVLNAPLNDPVKYKIMDYEVSLRRAEADLVEIVSKEEARQWHDSQTEQPSIYVDEGEMLSKVAEEKSRTINVAFVGNPNCGKTSLFNIAGNAHERVGNYSGVTVDAKKGELKFNGYHINIYDLPGTYSLSAYTPEELYVRKYIIEQTPDVIINVVDASNLERNLYLTTQIIDMDVPIVMALNMYDEFRESGNQLDIGLLGKLLGIPIIPTIGRTGEGVSELLQTVIDVCTKDSQSPFRHIHVNHGKLIEDAIEELEVPIRENPEPHHNYSGRFLAIKLLENDRQVEGFIQSLPNAEQIMFKRSLCQQAIRDEWNEDSESAMTDAKYGFIQGALKECFVRKYRRIPSRVLTKRIDAVVTNRWFGYVVFLLLMYLMFYCTYAIGQFPMDWIDSVVGWISDTVTQNMPEGILKALMVDGVISGVGGVIVFLPNILILYAFISWMEDSGYMARVAFIMDKIMHRMGLHGKSFIPMIMGFGCSIPAVMATRTIEDRKSRLITMLIVPLMSCSARLPIYIILIGAFFPHHEALVLFGLYLTGIVMSVLMAHLFSKFVVKGDTSPFVMELPPYRLPSAKSVTRHTWEKGKQYLRKMGTTILAASIIIWVLSYFPHTDGLSEEARMEQSYIGQLGKFVEPAIRPCGLGWKEGVSLISGIGAKEIVASTMGVLYSGDQAEMARAPYGGEEAGEDSSSRLSKIIANGGMTPAAALALMVFVLLYVPCIPTCIVISHESGHWRWALFTIMYSMVLAWLCSMIIYQSAVLIL
ncbi:MAG: ferrous iron transport protein B [Bacteroidaceae bacterium]|nr:ferrous iron transport protein B [Bacteroidaceae bacterium]